MPLTARGFVSDPLAPLAWDLFLARLGLAKLVQRTTPDEDERQAIADIGQVLAPLCQGEQIDPSHLISSRGGPLYHSPQASFAALTTIRTAMESPASPLRPEAAFGMVDASRYIQAGRSVEIDEATLMAAHDTCEILLEIVNSRRPAV